MTAEQAEREAAVMRIQNAAAYIPRALLSEQQALANHSQTLAELHSRGGLDAGEAASIILGEGWSEGFSRSVEEAWRVIFDAARAAGRAEGRAEGRADRIEILEHDLARVQALEGALRTLAWDVGVAMAGVGMHSNPRLILRALDAAFPKIDAALETARALLPHPAEGPEASQGDEDA